MLEHKPLSAIAGLQTDWLKAKHHFAIGPYGNPRHQPLGNLYVWNDDELAPHSGFPLHSHAEVEIITYVREGAVTHHDNLGNVERIEAGDVQVMSAGTGIRHSGHNEENIPTRIFQIWLHPAERAQPPHYATRPFPKDDRAGAFVTLASRNPSARVLPIRAAAELLAATLTAGTVVDQPLDKDGIGRLAYLVPASGTIMVNDIRVAAREGLVIRDEPIIRVEALSDAELVLVLAS